MNKIIEFTRVKEFLTDYVEKDSYKSKIDILSEFFEKAQNHTDFSRSIVIELKPFFVDLLLDCFEVIQVSEDTSIYFYEWTTGY